MDKKYSKIIKKALVATGTVFGAVATASAIGTKIIFDQTEKKKARLECKTRMQDYLCFHFPVWEKHYGRKGRHGHFVPVDDSWNKHG